MDRNEQSSNEMEVHNNIIMNNPEYETIVDVEDNPSYETRHLSTENNPAYMTTMMTEASLYEVP